MLDAAAPQHAISAAIREIDSDPELSPPVRQALAHIAVNFAAPITLGELASLTARTPFQLIRAFRKELGVTPHAMLIRIRIRRAAELLAEGVSIAGVAADVGFVDQTHFGRHFKRIHRQTPGRFRNAIRSLQPLAETIPIAV